MRAHRRIDTCEAYGGVAMSAHADKRQRQRGFSDVDVQLVLAHGDSVDDGYVMTRKAVSRRISELKKEIVRLQKLKDVAVIEDTGTVVTMYRADGRRMRKLTGRW